MKRPIPHLNLFMMCEKSDSKAFSGLPEEAYAQLAQTFLMAPNSLLQAALATEYEQF